MGFDLFVADRVGETTSTTGTGTLDLAGAIDAFQGFVAAGADGKQVPYLLVDANGSGWETGIGTVTDAATDTLSRDTILASSNSGAAISLSAGTHKVYLAPLSNAARPNSQMGGIWTPPPAAGWSWVNQGSASVTANKNGSIWLESPSNASVHNWRLYTRSAPSTPYTIDVVFSGISGGLSGGADAETMVGCGFRQASTGELEMFTISRDTTVPTTLAPIRVSRWDAPGTANSTYADTQGYGELHNGACIVRLEDDGVDRKFHVSPNGVNWIEYSTDVRTNFLTADEVCFGVNPFAVISGVVLQSWREA